MDIISKNKKRVLESVTKGFRPSGVSVQVNLSEEMSKSKIKGVLTRPEIKKAVIQLAEDYLSEVSKNFKDSKAIEQINGKLILDAKREFSDNSRNLRIGLAELDSTLQGQLRELKNELQNAKSDTEGVKRKALIDYQTIERSIKNVLGKIEALNIPKQVTLKAGRNVFIKKEEKVDSIEYTVNAEGSGGMPSGAILTDVLRRIYPGNNITVSPMDFGGGVTISSTGGAGSTLFAGDGIDINGSTITNTLPGVSLQAGDNISIVGLTITATTPAGVSNQAGFGININGLTITNTLPGVSNQAGFGIDINGLTVTNTLPGVSIQAGTGININGLTITNSIIGLSALNDVLITSGVTGDFLRYGNGVWINESILGIKNYYDSVGSTLTNKTFSLSNNTLVATIAQLNTVTSETIVTRTGVLTLTNKTINGSSNNIILNTNQVTEGTSSFYYTEAKFNSSLATKTTNDLAQGTSNFYYNPLSFVGTGGASVSVLGRTVTIFGLSTAIDHGTLTGLADDDHTQYHNDSRALTWLGTRTTNDLPEGVSNFYYNPLSFVGTGGVSASVTGRTVTLFGLSTALNTNNAIEGGSGLFYSSQRFSTDFALKTTDDLSEGTSNFYLRTSRFVGTGGVSVSVNGLTITFYGNSTAYNTNQISEGISNFYWRTDRVAGSTNITVTRSGVSLQIDLTKSGVSANYINGVGTWESPIQSKSIYLEGCTSTDFIPFYRVEQSMSLIKTVYDVSGGTNWVGQVQRWNNAQGASKFNTQSADTGVTTTQTVTSYSGSSFLQGEYIAIKGASIAGGVSWLLVNVYWRNN